MCKILFNPLKCKIKANCWLVKGTKRLMRVHTGRSGVTKQRPFILKNKMLFILKINGSLRKTDAIPKQLLHCAGRLHRRTSLCVWS